MLTKKGGKKKTVAGVHRAAKLFHQISGGDEKAIGPRIFFFCEQEHGPWASDAETANSRLRYFSAAEDVI